MLSIGTLSKRSGVKVPTIRYDPASGNPTFRSMEEFNRANKTGAVRKALPKGGYVQIGDQIYPVAPAGAEGG